MKYGLQSTDSRLLLLLSHFIVPTIIVQDDLMDCQITSTLLLHIISQLLTATDVVH